MVKGNTPDEARKKAAKNYGPGLRAMKTYHVFLVGPSAIVTGMGMIETGKNEQRPLHLYRVKNNKQIPAES